MQPVSEQTPETSVNRWRRIAGVVLLLCGAALAMWLAQGWPHEHQITLVVEAAEFDTERVRFQVAEEGASQEVVNETEWAFGNEPPKQVTVKVRLAPGRWRATTEIVGRDICHQNSVFEVNNEVHQTTIKAAKNRWVCGAGHEKLSMAKLLTFLLVHRRMPHYDLAQLRIAEYLTLHVGQHLHDSRWLA